MVGIRWTVWMGTLAREEALLPLAAAGRGVPPGPGDRSNNPLAERVFSASLYEI
jgi:hypothetical protein